MTTFTLDGMSEGSLISARMITHPGRGTHGRGFSFRLATHPIKLEKKFRPPAGGMMLRVVT